MKDGVWAAVPVKEFAGAKQRLSPLLTQAQRLALAPAMLEDVLAALTAAPLAGVMVNTLEPVAQTLARRYGARVVTDDARGGHTGAVAAMAAILEREGAEGMLTCPGDIPAITGAEICSVLRTHGETPAFTIVPAHDERGSNAILISPPQAMPLSFGDDSFLPHLDTARAHGMCPRIVYAEGISLDIDNPQDVRRFMAAPCARATRAYALLKEFLA